MDRPRRRPATPARVLAAAALFLASVIGGAFPAGSGCGGRALCLCCVGEATNAECGCPPDSRCGCRDAVRDLLPPDSAPAAGIAAPLPAGAPSLPVPAASRVGGPIAPDRVASDSRPPETPPPEI